MERKQSSAGKKNDMVLAVPVNVWMRGGRMRGRGDCGKLDHVW